MLFRSSTLSVSLEIKKRKPQIAAMANSRILLVTFPGQGHINPSLQFAKRLVGMGVRVTFLTTVSAFRCMTKTTTTQEGLIFESFSNGYDDGFPSGANMEHFMSELRTRGSEAVAELVTNRANEGQPFTQLVYTTLLAWVGQVGHRLCIPSTLLWIQPATILGIYYYYINGYGDIIRENCNDPSCPIELPGLPKLTSRDLPSFLLPSNSNVYNFLLPSMIEHLEILDEEENPKILVNTFDALESKSLRAIDKLNLTAVGPLIPLAFLDGKDPSDTSFGGDLFQKSTDYVEWLNSKPKSSVVYVSFGSISVLSKQQMEEIAIGLLESHRPFLWVVRATQQDEVCCRQELEQEGMIVPWCSQVEVLSHPSIGCFVTHCGWNSSIESVVSGVPVVAFPQWADQATNAKLIADVWKTGVRVTENQQGIVEGVEIKRCIEIIMGDGERGKELRMSAKKWKDSAREAVKEGGSSDMNLKAF